MLGKAIRKAVLPILLASLMVGTGCRIVYGKADISLNERAENHTSDNTAASPEEQEKTTEPAAPDDALVQAPSALFNGGQYRHCNLRKRFGYQAKSSEYYKDYDVNPDFRCVGEWYTENG